MALDRCRILWKKLAVKPKNDPMVYTTVISHMDSWCGGEKASNWAQDGY